MTTCNKLTATFLLALSSLITFAQESGATRPGRFPSDNPEDNFATPGGNEVPVDQYVYVLIGFAVMAIAYVVYTKRVAKTA